jgi:hypothetical protein
MGIYMLEAVGEGSELLPLTSLLLIRQLVFIVH